MSGRDENWRRQGTFSLNMLHCMIESLRWDICHPLEHLPEAKNLGLLCEKPPSRAHKQDCPVVRGTTHALHGLILKLLLCIQTAAIGVLCRFMADVHTLSLFQYVDADVYTDTHFSFTVAQ